VNRKDLKGNYQLLISVIENNFEMTRSLINNVKTEILNWQLTK